MNISVKVHSLFNGDKPLKAVCSVTVDDSFAIHNVKVVDNGKALFVAMPSEARKDKDGKKIYRDICHPVNTDVRKELECAVLKAYSAAISDGFLRELEKAAE